MIYSTWAFWYHESHCISSVKLQVSQWRMKCGFSSDMKQLSEETTTHFTTHVVKSSGLTEYPRAKMRVKPSTVPFSETITQKMQWLGCFSVHLTSCFESALNHENPFTSASCIFRCFTLSSCIFIANCAHAYGVLWTWKHARFRWPNHQDVDNTRQTLHYNVCGDNSYYTCHYTYPRNEIVSCSDLWKEVFTIPHSYEAKGTTTYEAPRLDLADFRRGWRTNILTCYIAAKLSPYMLLVGHAGDIKVQPWLVAAEITKP